MMLSFDIGANRFHYKAGMILIHKDKVLFQKPKNEDIWFLPGGRVEFFETSETALDREMMEELNLSLKSKQLVWLAEYLLELGERQMHELGLYYHVTVEENEPILTAEGEFVSMEPDYLHKWIKLDELDTYNIVPKFVIQELRDLDLSKGIKQIVCKAAQVSEKEEVMISAYNPDWILEYECEKEKLTEALADVMQGIEHIGSTSVPGLSAKPVIDMMIGVRNLQEIQDHHKESLHAIGYEFVDHAQFPERRFFRKGAWRAGTHHLHMYTIDSEHWQSNLLFRDYLRKNPDTCKAYMDLKNALKSLYPNDRVKYTEAKAPFIRSVIKKAKEED
ncbi:GrpB family protein [Paenibacillus sp. KN14-4R]|uniref:GrpB family protein n=1 Tax=Paenibacillus sp. KN14-4R TaxID=3445773 RepID=UPI003FA00731